MENNEEGKAKKIEDMKYEEITETIRKSLTMMRGYVEQVSKTLEKYLEALDKKYLEMINAKMSTIQNASQKVSQSQDQNKKQEEEKEEKQEEKQKQKPKYKQITF